MHDFIKHFVRDDAGVWTCIEPAEIDGPQGRVRVGLGARFPRGTRVMGVELAKLLEQQYEEDRARGPG